MFSMCYCPKEQAVVFKRGNELFSLPDSYQDVRIIKEINSQIVKASAPRDNANPSEARCEDDALFEVMQKAVEGLDNSH